MAAVVNQTYTRLDLATEQLDFAIALFLNAQSYVSALTLAGAAEEIFGRELTLHEHPTFLDLKYETLEPIHTILDGASLERKKFNDSENRVRNAAKHMSDTETTVTCDLEEEALWMIVRASYNFDRLGLTPTERLLEFDNWYHENVVGH